MFAPPIYYAYATVLIAVVALSLRILFWLVENTPHIGGDEQ